eukprot:1530907-Prorocentrum_lima.AAC.1
MAAWLVRRARWNVDHGAQHAQWSLAVTLWLLEAMEIHRTMGEQSERAADLLRAAGVSARTQRYLPCRAWARGEQTGVGGNLPGSNANEADAMLLGRVA